MMHGLEKDARDQGKCQVDFFGSISAVVLINCFSPCFVFLSSFDITFDIALDVTHSRLTNLNLLSSLIDTCHDLYEPLQLIISEDHHGLLSSVS